MFWDNQHHPLYCIVETENTKRYSCKRHHQNQSSASSEFLQLDGSFADEEDLSTDWELVRMLELDIDCGPVNDAQRRPRIARRMSSCMYNELRERAERLRARSDLDLRRVLS